MAGFRSFVSGLLLSLLYIKQTLAAPPVSAPELASLPFSVSHGARDAIVPLTLNLVNGLTSTNVYAYITTIDLQTNQAVLITGTDVKLVPAPATMYVPERVPADCGILLGAQGTTISVPLGMPLSNARVYFAQGEMEFWAYRDERGYTLNNPSCESGKTGFVEVNQGGDCNTWANPSFVDFVGLASPFMLKSNTGNVTIESMPADGATQVCEHLKKAEEDSDYPWTFLCKRDDQGIVYQVTSPMNANATLFNGYWNTTIDVVWSLIGTNGIVFDLQSNEHGNTTCHMDTSSSMMLCDGISKPFSKPLSSQIWGCVGGPFTGDNDAHGHIGARLCAAFHRGTLLLPGGMFQPSQPASMYYQTGQVFNEYAKAVHAVSSDGRGYAFPVDDVKPEIMGAEVAGLVGMKAVTEMTIFVGGKAAQVAGIAASPSPYTAMAVSSATPTTQFSTSSTTSTRTSTAQSSTLTTSTPVVPASPTTKTSASSSTSSTTSLAVSVQGKGTEHSSTQSSVATQSVGSAARKAAWVTVTKVETAVVLQTATVTVAAH